MFSQKTLGCHWYHRAPEPGEPYESHGKQDLDLTQMVKHLSALQETRVQSLGWDDPLEEGMASHSSNLTWRIPWTEEPGRLLSMGSQRVGHD